MKDPQAIPLSQAGQLGARVRRLKSFDTREEGTGGSDLQELKVQTLLCSRPSSLVSISYLTPYLVPKGRSRVRETTRVAVSLLVTDAENITGQGFFIPPLLE